MTDMWTGGTLLNENPSMNCRTTLHRDNHNSLKEEQVTEKNKLHDFVSSF